MTTLTNTVCKEHTPHVSAISSINDEQYTFCEVCENNIDRFWLEFDGDRLDMWSEWRVTK
jgi:RNA polymerase-binding transcription factor DksA